MSDDKVHFTTDISSVDSIKVGVTWKQLDTYQFGMKDFPVLFQTVTLNIVILMHVEILIVNRLWWMLGHVVSGLCCLLVNLY